MRRAAALLLAIASVAACANLVDERLGAGLGATCEADDQCQGSSCLDGICTIRCGDDNGCPGGTVCSNEICELPMRVGYVYPYPVAQDELALSIDLGRLAAEAELQYVSSDAVENQLQGYDAAEDLVETGHGVIVSTSTEQAATFAAFAQNHTDVSVLAFSSPAAGGNLTSFDARMYQAYYLAGYAAAKTSNVMPPRLGMIASVAIPSVIARINAFALGAQLALVDTGTQATIEIKWLGDWHDKLPPQNGIDTREVIFTRELLTNGADVIAHTLDNNVPLNALPRIAMEDGLEGFAVAANLEAACASADAPDVAMRCVGSAFYNWGPVLSRALTEIQRGNGGGRILLGLTVGGEDSAVGFQLGPAAPTALGTEIPPLRNQLAVEGVGPVFKGPIISDECTQMGGPSPCVPENETLSEEALQRMCWFVDGVGLVDRQGGATDQNAIVPEACAESLGQN